MSGSCLSSMKWWLCPLCTWPICFVEFL